VLKPIGRIQQPDKIDCVYIAPNEERIRDHAKLGGFPANRISEIKLVIDPPSSEAGPVKRFAVARGPKAHVKTGPSSSSW